MMRVPTKNATKPPLFDETKLAEEVARVWGAHGAHSEVLRMLMADSKRYRWIASKAVSGDWGYLYGWKIELQIKGAPSIETLEQAINDYIEAGQ